MKSPLILLTLLAFVYGGPFPGEEDGVLLFEPEADAEPPPEVTVAELCSRLGLNTFVKLLKELNLTQLLETHPIGGRLTVIFWAYYEINITSNNRKIDVIALAKAQV